MRRVIFGAVLLLAACGGSADPIPGEDQPAPAQCKLLLVKEECRDITPPPPPPKDET